MAEWFADIRATFDEAFEFDWATHVRGLNERFALSGANALLESDAVPELFWADLGGFQRGQWVAVISLNPQVMSEDDLRWHAAQDWTRQALWDYLTRRDLRSDLDGVPYQERDYFYTRFARPLVMLAGRLLGIADPQASEVQILMRRMGLFEIMPYPSKAYLSNPARAIELSRGDLGCQLSTRIATLAIEQCPPAAVLLNGKDAVSVFGAIQPPGWTWEERRYDSATRAGKTLRHWEGMVIGRGHRVPVVGFPQLRTRGSHNSNVEIQQLSDRLADLVATAG